MTGTANEDNVQASESLTLIEDICRVAHRVWREQRIQEGWEPGSFDDEALTHDALVPFEKLGKRDLHVLGVAVEAEEVKQLLLRTVNYERGPERLFMIDEMEPGMRVGMSRLFNSSENESCNSDSSESSDLLGTVMSWKMDEDHPDQLGFIEVRWDDGEVMQYHPESRDLRRIED